MFGVTWRLCHWRIYWAGTLTLLKTIRDVLDRVDRHESSAHSRVIHDFLKYLALKKHLHPIYWEFVCKERDNLVHEFSLSAQEAPVTTRPFLVDSEMSYAELAEKYGERKIIIWGDDGEDGLRLLELALKWWEEHLRIIEQATRDHDKHPFSSDYRHRHALLEKTFAYINRFDYDWERGLITPPPLPFS